MRLHLYLSVLGNSLQEGLRFKLIEIVQTRRKSTTYFLLVSGNDTKNFFNLDLLQKTVQNVGRTFTI